MNTIVQKIRSSPTLMALIAIALFTLMGYGAGRYLVPVKVETVHIQDTESKTKLEEALKVTESLREQLAVTEKKLQDIKVNTITVTKWVKAPDGAESRETTKTTESDTYTDITADTTKSTTKDTAIANNTTSISDVHTHIEDRKTVTLAPTWQVTAFGTFELVAPAHPTSFGQVSPVLFYGGSAGYRFWGPFWVDLGGGGTKDVRTGASGFWAGATLRGTLTF